jgi:hypothetical protein
MVKTQALQTTAVLKVTKGREGHIMNPKDRRNQRRERVAKHLNRKAKQLQYKGSGELSRQMDRLDHERRKAHTQES